MTQQDPKFDAGMRMGLQAVDRGGRSGAADALLFDAKGRLVICNRPYARIYQLTDDLIREVNLDDPFFHELRAHIGVTDRKSVV